MTMRPVRLQQRGGGLHGLQQLLVGRTGGGSRGRSGRCGGRCGRRRRRWRRQLGQLDAKGGEHPLVETFLATKQRLDPLEEATRIPRPE